MEVEGGREEGGRWNPDQIEDPIGPRQGQSNMKQPWNTEMECHITKSLLRRPSGPARAPRRRLIGPPATGGRLLTRRSR
eukprot:6039181-Pyramimonas_sp.AAC.1